MAKPEEELLIGLKEIAVYMRISERTAIRYSKERGLQVKRDHAGHPVIKKIEIDKWRVA